MTDKKTAQHGKRKINHKRSKQSEQPIQRKIATNPWSKFRCSPKNQSQCKWRCLLLYSPSNKWNCRIYHKLFQQHKQEHSHSKLVKEYHNSLKHKRQATQVQSHDHKQQILTTIVTKMQEKKATVQLKMRRTCVWLSSAHVTQQQHTGRTTATNRPWWIRTTKRANWACIACQTCEAAWLTISGSRSTNRSIGMCLCWSSPTIHWQNRKCKKAQSKMLMALVTKQKYRAKNQRESKQRQNQLVLFSAQIIGTNKSKRVRTATKASIIPGLHAPVYVQTPLIAHVMVPEPV